MQLKFIAIGCAMLAFAVLAGKVGADALGNPKAQETVVQPTTESSPYPGASLSPSLSQEETDAKRRELRAKQPLAVPSPTVTPEPSQPVQLAPSLPIAQVLPQQAANLRAAPSTQSIVKGVVMPGQKVQIKPGAIVQNGVTWYPVVVGEDEGWIASSLLNRPQMPAETRWYQPEPENQSASVQMPTSSL